MTIVPSTLFLPRIYCLPSQLAGSASGLEKHLDRCMKMGFDHLLVPMHSTHRRPGDDSVYLSDEAIAALARLCVKKKLRLLLDLDIAAISADDSILESHPDWFSSGEFDDLPDPRRAGPPPRSRVLRLAQADIAEAVSAYWQQRMRPWLHAGVTGFRCMNVAAVPPSFWQQFIGSVKTSQAAARFLAWTPGCTPPQLQALAGCGFDATFSSSAWWDYRSHWMTEEYARLNLVAPPIAFPDSPDEPVIARIPGYDEMALRRGMHLRALGLAAAIGNGMLMPMGFEYGMTSPAGVPGDDLPATETPDRDAAFDLTDEVARLNEFIAAGIGSFYAASLRMLSGEGSGIAVLMRSVTSRRDTGGKALLILANADVSHACTVSENQLMERADGFVPHERIWPATDAPMHTIELAPAGLQFFSTRRLPPILMPLPEGDQPVTAAVRAPRIAIEAITPSVDEGRFPVKRTLGDVVHIEADVFVDGHEKIAVSLLWRAADEADWHEMRMHPLGNDRWCATLPMTRIGRYLFTVEAWRDAFATYRDELEKKSTAGLNVALELEEGRLLVEAAARYADRKRIARAAAPLKALAKMLKERAPADKASDKVGEHGNAHDSERIAALLSEPTAEAMRLADARPFAVRREPPLRIDVDRSAARFSSWYELFPRSQSGDAARHGNFDDVIRRLPAIQAMGFDTLYFTPIHPIGRKHRKGRNNSLTPGPDDPGSPYAIGAEEGGHDAIHPQLGALEDFRRLRDEAAKHGLELALDFAIQCSPDHPWLKEHPEWFAWRPDGTIRYAENPPKKYQDIVNVDFYAKGALPGLWSALRDVVLFWVNEGVRVFRVDNPHTKPLPFWEWLIADIRGRYPDTIFLSEAFTRPKMMYRLAKVGYAQSYTYFTWRHSKEEFTAYLTELTTTKAREFFRPHFFVNTPDINPYFLQRSGRPGFLIRAALATMLSGLWGMYSGFELCEAAPVPGKEEYLDSEKYEIRAWDWHRPGNIVSEISVLNRIRSENPALQSHLGIRFLNASDDHILYFVKSTEPVGSGRHHFGDNIVLVAINLDPFAPHEATIELPLWELDLPDDGALELEDLVNGRRMTWQGKFQQLRLDPFVCPYAIWRVRHKGM
ncbi:maltotransferase domain-containing protein [Herbaspirillum sp. ST 5-3]|uniref:maltotransferase domain-containing protein n=1 Tax=Oxalobacteraceae TaxID=75682 RepID=UPI0010A3DA90|nr:maltotransferase domain-containing protein [Herbaspirillum sp. ST 5-3]